MVKCVRRVVVLSGARSSAANGLFSCIPVAAFCSARHFSIAASICALVRGSFDVPAVLMLGAEVGCVVGADGRADDLVEETGVKGALFVESDVALRASGFVCLGDKF